MSLRAVLCTVAALVLAIPILACGASGATCTGWVEDDQGVRHSPESGTGEGEAQAQRFACNTYCMEADAMVEARYAIWRDSPQGNPSMSRHDALIQVDSLREYVIGTCADACVADVASGARRGGVDCR